VSSGEKKRHRLAQVDAIKQERKEMSNHLYPTIEDSLEVEVLSAPEQFYCLREEWDLLFQSCQKASVFQSFPYNYVCHKYHEKESKLEIIVVREDKEIVGIGPFVIRKRFGVTQIEPIGGTNQIAYFGMLVSDERVDVVASIAKTIAERYPKGIIHIPYFNSGNFEINVMFAKLLSMGWKEIRWVRNISHFMIVKNGFEEYLSWKSSKARYNIRRKWIKLQGSGDVKIIKYSHIDLSENIVDRMANIQKRSWLYRRGIDTLDSPFYKELILSLAENKNAEAFILTIDDRDIAFVLNYCSQNVHYLMYTAFEETASNLNPGGNLDKYCFEYLCKKNNIIYDFMFGDGEYKRYWSNRTNIILRAVCYRGAISWIISFFPHRLHGKLSKYNTLKNMRRFIYKKRI
jgi:CelD/BcsL family acetyltransferase involved in cellulose biosynthesis